MVSVTYTLTWNESRITAVQADIIAANVPLSDVSGEFIVHELSMEINYSLFSNPVWCRYLTQEKAVRPSHHFDNRPQSGFKLNERDKRFCRSVNFNFRLKFW